MAVEYIDLVEPLVRGMTNSSWTVIDSSVGLIRIIIARASSL